MNFGEYFKSILGTAATAYTAKQQGQTAADERRAAEARARAAAAADQNSWKKYIPLALGALLLLGVLGFVFRKK